jgi:hypothetical protein
MLALSQLSKTPSVEISSSEDSSSDDNSDINLEPRRSGRVKRLIRDAASQASQDRAAAAALPAATKSPKGRKVRKGKLVNVPQLLDEFTIG